ncbi:hypothetical protein [Pelagibaculum spongiae]|uniref:FCP1 homology domain-containing protein n=1 Tax=Pelagibaculum spongiae TaxID=2080658 RepID=A0A2V1GQ27_9GAMM|nr:hypothetical protein [Pelagibaculum spongiae]PVZ65456.1 hypothetical protein DC094_18425 [Pelagibaculum spongiae]
MWHVFFDLDLTLFAIEGGLEKLSAHQQAKTCMVYTPISTKKTQHAVFPLYTFEHLNFFNSTLQNSHLHFITAGLYEEASAKRAILKMFSIHSEEITKKIYEASFYNRNDLEASGTKEIVFACNIQSPVKVDPSNTAQIQILDYAKAKAAIILKTYLQANDTLPGEVVLIDDSVANRVIVKQQGFQAINPTTADYPMMLTLLSDTIARNESHFFSLEEVLAYNFS